MNLQLPLNKKWFEMTKLGYKTEDYREINAYWCSRLLLLNGKKETQVFWATYLERFGVSMLKAVLDKYDGTHRLKIKTKSFHNNIMTLGYPKKTNNERILKLEHKGIEIRTGNENWGAEPNKLYFVIKHGKLR